MSDHPHFCDCLDCMGGIRHHGSVVRPAEHVTELGATKRLPALAQGYSGPPLVPHRWQVRLRARLVRAAQRVLVGQRPEGGLTR